MTRSSYLITGSMGCLGAWTLYHLVKQGKRGVGFDLSADRQRLNLLLSPAEQELITFVQGDLTDFETVLNTFRQHNITHIVHLAALQVPFCRANPVKGAQVNVVGSVNVFEAARQTDIDHIVQASSIAVYGRAEDYPPGLIDQNAPLAPRTLYGVYKVASESIARVYWQDHRVGSTTLRPYTVYGVGRDQGLTSEPTKAMLGAAMERPYHISFGGVMQFQLASDVALQFIEAAEHPLKGAYCFNLGSKPTPVSDLVKLIAGIKPKSVLTHGEEHLPFPTRFDNTELRKHFTDVFETPLEEGVEQTIAHFERCLNDGLIQTD